MGIFSIFAKSTYRGICSAMINSYNIVKQRNPDISSRESYARALALRPTWKRQSESSFTFLRGRQKLDIEEKDTLRDVVRNLIISETMSAGSANDPDYMINTIKDIASVVDEKFKGFEE